MSKLITAAFCLFLPAGLQAQIHNQSAITASGGHQGQIGSYHFEFSLGETISHTGYNENLFVTTGILQPLASGISLPVTLIGFELTHAGHEGVHLHWTTTHEMRSKLFEIERSHNAQQWKGIGTVPAAGEAEAIREYFFVDTGLSLPGHEPSCTVFYRLKMVDLDNSFSFSPIRSITIKNDANQPVEVYPNPAADRLYIRHPEGLPFLAFTLYDLNGREVARQAGTNVMNVSHLKAGLYFLTARDQHNTFTRHKVIITR